MILNKIMLILLFLTSAAYGFEKDESAASEKEKASAFDAFLTEWKSTWNSTVAKGTFKNTAPNQSFPYATKRYLLTAKAYGKIKEITFIKTYEDNTVYQTEIEFENKFKFPFLFQFHKNDASKFRNFFPGQDPSIKRDDKKTKEFLDEWVKVWNEKSPEKLMQITHSKSKMKIYLSSLPKEQRDKMMKEVSKRGFEEIKGYKIIGYKQITNEYIITVNYAAKGEVTGAMMIKKDTDGVIKVFNLDVDDGELALQQPKSWYPQ